MSRRLTILFAVAVLVIALDQWTKALVRAHVTVARSYAGGLFTLLHTENTGAFLSLGAELPPLVRTIIFSVFVAALLIGFIVAVARGTIGGHGATYAAAAIIGGGVGNLIDRIARDGRVTDFLYLEAGPLHTGVFNVADMAITFGVIWLLLTSARKD